MVIRIKKKTEINFKELWPLIDEKDFELLENQELRISAVEHQKLEANKYLNLGGFHIPIDAIEIKEASLDNELLEAQAVVGEKFIFCEDMVDILFAGVESGKNVILWGRGGHGKSEVTELVLKHLHEKNILKEEPFVQAFGDGLTEEKLFGGMNIKKYKEEGVIEYLPENSFMNFEVVVFEEIFDAPSSVLLSLKDIMTSGKFRQGTEVFDVKTKLIIGLTNKSKKEFSEKDESLKALAERFPLTLNVEWKHYKKTNFIKLFKTVLGQDKYNANKSKLSELANIIDMNNASGNTFVSPRTAVAAAELFLMGKKLEYISEIDPDILAKYNQTQTEEKFTSLHTDLLQKLETYIDDHELDTIDQDEDFLQELSALEEEIGEDPIDLSFLEPSSLKKKEEKLNKTKFMLALIDRVDPTPSLFKKFTGAKQRLNEIIKTINADIESAKDAQTEAEPQQENAK